MWSSEKPQNRTNFGEKLCLRIECSSRRLKIGRIGAREPNGAAPRAEILLAGTKILARNLPQTRYLL